MLSPFTEQLDCTFLCHSFNTRVQHGNRISSLGAERRCLQSVWDSHEALSSGIQSVSRFTMRLPATACAACATHHTMTVLPDITRSVLWATVVTRAERKASSLRTCWMPSALNGHRFHLANTLRSQQGATFTDLVIWLGFQSLCSWYALGCKPSEQGILQ